MQSASKSFISNLKKQKHDNDALLFLDNVKIIKDAIANKSIDVKCILTTLEKIPFEFDEEKTFHTDMKTIEILSDTKTPQKVLCIAYLTQDIEILPKTNFLVLDHLQDPGNVGTLIRSAKASGFETIYLVDSVKKTNSKLIRSSVGAVFDSKIVEISTSEFLKLSKQNNFNLLCCDMNGENVFDFHTDKQVGVVIGNEGQGVCEQISKICFKTIKIPMKSGIESLNAGVSGSIIMYEINKNKF